MNTEKLQKAINDKIVETLNMRFVLPKTPVKWARKYLKNQKFNFQAYDAVMSSLEDPLFKYADNTKYYFFLKNLEDCIYAAKLLSIFKANEDYLRKTEQAEPHEDMILSYCKFKKIRELIE